MERWPVIKDILLVFLPVISSVVTWFVSRRKRNNDFLSEMQASINLLSTENKEILSENVHLRRENAEQKANQQEMLDKLNLLAAENKDLRRENAELKANQRKMIDKLNNLTREVENLRKNFSKENGKVKKNTTSSAARDGSVGLRDQQIDIDHDGGILAGGTPNRKGRGGRSRNSRRPAAQCTADSDGHPDDEAVVCGTDPERADLAGDSDTEPP